MVNAIQFKTQLDRSGLTQHDQRYVRDLSRHCNNGGVGEVSPETVDVAVEVGAKDPRSTAAANHKLN